MNLSVITRVFGVAAMVLSVFTYAQDKAELPEQTLFKNVNVFNGVDKQLYKNYFVLVEKIGSKLFLLNLSPLMQRLWLWMARVVP